MTRRSPIPLPSRLAALMAASIWAIPAISDAAEGTIHFTGSIVEPPYEMQIVPIGSGSVSSATAAGVEVTLSSSRQSANVRADSLGKLPLTVKCPGRITIPIIGCHFDRRGGMLSVEMKSGSPIVGAPLAVVTVSYD